jgi:hypothetical protein
MNGLRPPVDDPSTLGQLRRLPADLEAALERRRAGKDIYIYANDRWLPRFRFVKRVILEPTPGAALDRLSGMSATELTDAAVATQDAPGVEALPLAFEPGAEASVSVACYTPDEIVLATDNDGDGLLIAAMTWNPFWTVLVDQVPQPLVRVNHAQLAVQTPAGTREVRLRYRPPYAALAVGRLVPGGACPAVGAQIGGVSSAGY